MVVPNKGYCFVPGVPLLFSVFLASVVFDYLYIICWILLVKKKNTSRNKGCPKLCLAANASWYKSMVNSIVSCWLYDVVTLSIVKLTAGKYSS
jgi:hypothetical protein